MRWLSGLFLLFCQAVLALGQSQFVIRGRVVDAGTNEPLSYATVALVKFPMIEDILKGVVTDGDGKFELKVARDQYTLIIRNLGYRNYVYELTPEMEGIVELGMIRLKVQPEQLEVVTVKPLVEVSADEIKYDLSADPDRETASLHSILDKVPMIHRSPMGDLYVDEPDKKFLVVRNGKVDALFSGNLNDILKALPAKGFASVTVMLAPPGRYGEFDYVINIETDKHVSLYGAVGTLKEEENVGGGVFSSEATVIASLNALRLSVGGSFQNTHIPLTKQFVHKQVAGESKVFQQQRRNGASGEAWGSGGTFSYDLSKQHFLNWRLGYQEEHHRDKSRLKSGYENEEMTISDFINKKHSSDWRGGIDYQYDIGTTKQVLNVSYAFKLLPVDRRGQENKSLLSVWNRAEEKQQEQVVQIHYYHPLGRFWKLETGGGYLYRYYFSEDMDGQKEADHVLFSESSSCMEAHKHIVNGYFRLDYSRKRFGAGIELKADYLNDGRGTKIKLPEREEEISETGFMLIPKMRLNWLFPKCKFSRLGLEYQLNHSRPPFRMLSTYEDVSNADYVQVGNPDLRPQKQHLLRIGTYIKGFNINAIWNYSGDRIGEYWYLDQSGRTIHTYGNYGFMSGYSLNTSYSYSRKGFTLSLMLGGNYTYAKMPRKEKQEDWSVNTLCMTGYAFKNQLNMGLTIGYNDRFQSGYSAFQMPVWSLAVWGKKKLFKERVELEIYYSDLTRFTRKTEYQVNAVDFRMRQRIEQNYIPLTVKISWRIGSFQLKPARNIRKSVVVDDLLEE